MFGREGGSNGVGNPVRRVVGGGSKLLAIRWGLCVFFSGITQFLSGKSERNNKYLEICRAIPSNCNNFIMEVRNFCD